MSSDFIVHVAPSPQLAKAHKPKEQKRLNVTRPRSITFPWQSMSVRYCISNAKRWYGLSRIGSVLKDGTLYQTGDCVVLTTDPSELLQTPAPLYTSPGLRTGEHLAYILEIRGKDASDCQGQLLSGASKDGAASDVENAESSECLGKTGALKAEPAPETQILVSFFHRPEDIEMASNRPSKRFPWQSRREVVLGDWLQVYPARMLKKLADVTFWDESSEPMGEYCSERAEVALGDPFMRFILCSIREAGRLPVTEKARPISSMSSASPCRDVSAFVRLGLVNDFSSKQTKQRFFSDPWHHCSCNQPHNPDTTLVYCKHCHRLQHARCLAADFVRRVRIARFGERKDADGEWWQKDHLVFDPFAEPVQAKNKRRGSAKNVSRNCFPYWEHPRSNAVVDFGSGGFVATLYQDLNSAPGAGHLPGKSSETNKAKISWCRHSKPPKAPDHPNAPSPSFWRVAMIDFMDSSGVVKMPSMEWVVEREGGWGITEEFCSLTRADSGYDGSERAVDESESSRGQHAAINRERTASTEMEKATKKSGLEAEERALNFAREDFRTSYTCDATDESDSDGVDNIPIRHLRASRQQMGPRTLKGAGKLTAPTSSKAGRPPRGIKRKFEDAGLMSGLKEDTHNLPVPASGLGPSAPLKPPEFELNVDPGVGLERLPTRKQGASRSVILSSSFPPSPAESSPSVVSASTPLPSSSSSPSFPLHAHNPRSKDGNGCSQSPPPRGKLAVGCVVCLLCGAEFE